MRRFAEAFVMRLRSPLVLIVFALFLVACSSDAPSGTPSAPPTAPPSDPPSATASMLAFASQPHGVVAGEMFAGPITVEVRDAAGRIVADATDQVQLRLERAAGDGLSGAANVRAVRGVATFAGLSVHAAQPGYTLRAEASGLAPATSAAFDVGAARPVSLERGSGIDTLAPAGAAVLATVAVRDAYANLVPDAPVAFTVTAGGGSVAASTTTDVSGVARATWMLGPTPGHNTLAAALGSLSGSPVVFRVTSVAPPPGTPAMGLSPMSFSIGAGNCHPGSTRNCRSSGVLSITNLGGGTLVWTATADQTWLRMSQTVGTAPSKITITASRWGLTRLHTYLGHITISAAGAFNGTQTIPVTVKVY